MCYYSFIEPSQNPAKQRSHQKLDYFLTVFACEVYLNGSALAFGTEGNWEGEGWLSGCPLDKRLWRRGPQQTQTSVCVTYVTRPDTLTKHLSVKGKAWPGQTGTGCWDVPSTAYWSPQCNTLTLSEYTHVQAKSSNQQGSIKARKHAQQQCRSDFNANILA